MGTHTDVILPNNKMLPSKFTIDLLNLLYRDTDRDKLPVIKCSNHRRDRNLKPRFRTAGASQSDIFLRRLPDRRCN